MRMTTHKEASEIWAGCYCIKPIVLEKVLRDLNNDPLKASYEFRAMPMADAQVLLFEKAFAMPLEELQEAPWH